MRPLPHGRKRRVPEIHLIRCRDSEVFLLQIHLSGVEPGEARVMRVRHRQENGVVIRTVVDQTEIRVDRAGALTDRSLPVREAADHELGLKAVEELMDEQ